MSHIKMHNPGIEFFMPKIDEHAEIIEREIEKILNEAGIALDEPGIELMQVIPENNPLQFIYQVKRNGVTVGTFGLEMTEVRDAFEAFKQEQLAEILRNEGLSRR